MFEAILGIVLIAVIGSLTVPLTMIALARFGYFEPIQIMLFGRRWRFAPPTKTIIPSTNASTVAFPRQVVFASAVTTILTVALPGIRQEANDIHSDAATIIHDAMQVSGG